MSTNHDTRNHPPLDQVRPLPLRGDVPLHRPHLEERSKGIQDVPSTQVLTLELLSPVEDNGMMPRVTIETNSGMFFNVNEWDKE